MRIIFSSAMLVAGIFASNNFAMAKAIIPVDKTAAPIDKTEATPVQKKLTHEARVQLTKEFRHYTAEAQKETSGETKIANITYALIAGNQLTLDQENEATTNQLKELYKLAKTTNNDKQKVKDQFFGMADYLTDNEIISKQTNYEKFKKMGERIRANTSSNALLDSQIKQKNDEKKIISEQRQATELQIVGLTKLVEELTDKQKKVASEIDTLTTEKNQKSNANIILSNTRSQNREKLERTIKDREKQIKDLGEAIKQDEKIYSTENSTTKRINLQKKIQDKKSEIAKLDAQQTTDGTQLEKMNKRLSNEENSWSIWSVLGYKS